MVLMLAGGLLASACEGGTGPTMPAQTPVSEITRGGSSIGYLAGLYEITIGIPETCAEAAGVPASRTYLSTLGQASTQYGYLSLSIGTLGRGEAWPHASGSIRISVNNFDIGGCDGGPEILPDGRAFNICGEGVLTIGTSSISGTINGATWIGSQADRGTWCQGPHSYTFVRRQ